MSDETTQIPELQVLCGAQYRGPDGDPDRGRRCTMPAGHGRVEDPGGDLWDHGDATAGGESFWWIVVEQMPEAEAAERHEGFVQAMTEPDEVPTYLSIEEAQELAAATDSPEEVEVPQLGTVEITIGAVRLSLFCWACNGVHSLLAEQVEVLVYTLCGWIADIDTDTARAVDVDLVPLCLLEAIEGGGSAEGYAEHVEQGIACRIYASTDARPIEQDEPGPNLACDRCGDLARHMIAGALLCDECAKDAVR